MASYTLHTHTQAPNTQSAVRVCSPASGWWLVYQRVVEPDEGRHWQPHARSVALANAVRRPLVSARRLSPTRYGAPSCPLGCSRRRGAAPPRARSVALADAVLHLFPVYKRWAMCYSLNLDRGAILSHVPRWIFMSSLAPCSSKPRSIPCAFVIRRKHSI